MTAVRQRCRTAQTIYKGEYEHDVNQFIRKKTYSDNRNNEVSDDLDTDPSQNDVCVDMGNRINLTNGHIDDCLDLDNDGGNNCNIDLCIDGSINLSLYYKRLSSAG